jgi:hypothetical protein
MYGASALMAASGSEEVLRDPPLAHAYLGLRDFDSLMRRQREACGFHRRLRRS